MTDTNTLKEFLVALGFSIDENGFKKFDSAVAKATKGAMGLGIASTASAAAVVAFVAKISQSLDRLYFVTKRTGAAADEIKAFGYSVSQLGGTAEDAQASLENLARFMRTQPGSGGLLTRALGVRPENLKDAAKVMDDLARSFQRMPFYLASRYANLLGIDEKTLMAMRDGSFVRYQKEHNAKLVEFGVNAEEAAKKGHDFMTGLRGLNASFDSLTTKIGVDFMPVGEAFLTWANNAMHGVSALSSASGGYADFFYKMGQSIGLKLRENGVGPALPADTPGDPSAPRGIRNNNPGNLRRWGNMPTSGGFAMFPTPGAGLIAMAKQLRLYGERGWDTVAKIVDHWAPASDGNNTAAYKRALADRLGVGWNTKLDMRDTNTMVQLMRGITQHENGRNPYSVPLMTSAARAAIGGGATLNQTNNFNISGADAQATARATGSELTRVNQQAVRNLVGAVQ